MVRFVLIYSHTKLSGKLTKLFTGSAAYHCGFLDEATDTFYDMHWIPRKISWKDKGYKDYTLHPCPVTAEQCEKYMKQDSLNIRYGWMDYILFGLRPFYHLIGKSTRNADGWICSEMCNVWWWRSRHEGTPFELDDQPPSPADFERWLKHAG